MPNGTGDGGHAQESSFSIVNAISVIVVIGFFVVIATVQIIIPDNASAQVQSITNMLIGALIASFTTVIGYHFGSSRGAKDAAAANRDLAATTAATAATVAATAAAVIPGATPAPAAPAASGEAPAVPGEEVARTTTTTTTSIGDPAAGRGTTVLPDNNNPGKS